jgi:pyochelin synthetase
MLQDPVTNAIELLTQLRKEGISLWEENGKLRYRAPQGILKDNDLQTLKDNKRELLDLLETEAKSVNVVPDPKSRYEPFPLTDIQSAYLLGRHEAFGYGGVACHIYLELNYPELEPKRTEAVWNQLVFRHEMLRAIIDQNGHQRILKSVPSVKISYIDASNWEEQKVENILAEIREKMGYRLYDTERWPLFDIAITKISNEVIFHFSMDFLIADWASMWLLLSEFETLYEDPETQLPELNLSFRDYLLTERGLRETPAYHRDKEYWFRRVDTLPSAPNLPLAPRRQDDSGTASFRRRFLQLDKPTWDKLTQYAQKRGLTPTVVVMTAYAAVIGKWSRNKKFSLNITVLNRLGLHSQVNDIVGDFTTINLLAVDWQVENSFTKQAKALSRQLFEDLEHRSFSGVEVLREITRRRGREAALMPIVFTSAIGLTKNNQLKGKFKGHGISQTPQVFIDCQAMDGSEGLQVNWDVRQGVFPEQMVDDMFDAFEQLLRSLTTTDQIWDTGEVITLPAWQQLERDKVNDTKAPLKEQLLHQLILAQATATPDRPAVFDGEGQITYRELVQKAAAIAKKLKELGCATQERVAVVMEKGAHQVAAVLGILSAGAVYVPIDANQPELRRSAMLEQAQIKFILTSSTTQISWPEKIKTIEADKLKPLQENLIISENDPALPAYIIYTSGSTGEPKGVVVSHRAAFNTITDINHRFNIDQDDRVLGLAQLSFDLSVYDTFGPLSVGGALVYPSVERLTDPSHWAELMVEHDVTVWNSVPALMQMLLDYLNTEPKIALSKLRLVLLSGDWIPLSQPDMVSKYLPPDAQIISLGGATEASIWSIYHIYEGLKAEWQSIPYGRPLANQGFRILDSRMRDCPVWVTGELHITGRGLAEGYLNDKKTTQERFSLHPVDGQQLYRTGDLGRYLPGGEIEFLGREDNQIKIKGHRIELGEIESGLLKHPAVATAAVVATGSNESKALLAFVETSRDLSVQESELLNFLSQYLPAYMIPSHLQIVDALPLTPNGKVDRHKLATWRPDSIAEEPTVEEEGSDRLEAELAQLWAEALNIPSIGISESFFDHGADSLLMAQMSGKVREKLAEEPSREEIPFDALLQQMLNTPTVAALTEFIYSHSKNTELTPDEAKLTSDETTLTSGFTSQTSSNALLIPYGGGETGPLRVVFHAALGTMNYFRFLLSHLKHQNLGPIIGVAVADPELYCRAEPSGLIEQVADDYTERLLENGHKQIQLIGYSLGGLIAVEVARRLIEKGISLTDLVLIDSYPVFFDIEDDLINEALFLEQFHITLAQVGFGEVNPDDVLRGSVQLLETNSNNCIPKGSSVSIGGDEGLNKVGKLFQRLSAFNRKERFTAYANAITKSSDEQMPIEAAEVLFKVFRQSGKAARFTPPPFIENIRLLLARDQYSFLSGMEQKILEFWREACLGELNVLEIEGNHISCIEEEPQATQVAKLIAAPLYL